MLVGKEVGARVDVGITGRVGMSADVGVGSAAGDGRRYGAYDRRRGWNGGRHSDFGDASRSETCQDRDIRHRTGRNHHHPPFDGFQIQTRSNHSKFLRHLVDQRLACATVPLARWHGPNRSRRCALIRRISLLDDSYPLLRRQLVESPAIGREAHPRYPAHLPRLRRRTPRLPFHRPLNRDDAVLVRRVRRAAARTLRLEPN